MRFQLPHPFVLLLAAALTWVIPAVILTILFVDGVRERNGFRIVYTRTKWSR